MSDCVARTHVYHGDKKFLVSTINRGSSAAAAHGSIYAETMAWELNKENLLIEKMVGQGESCKDGLSEHFRAVKSLSEHGVYMVESDD